MSLIDLFKEFHSQTVEKEYPVSARLLGYWLIGEFNKAHWQEELTFSERDLYRLTGLPASTIHHAIKYLCDRGHIKTWRKKKTGATIFKLLSNKTPQSANGAPPMHETCTNEAPVEQPASISIERTREDVKTLDVKTEKTQSAGVRETLKQVDSPDELGGDIGEFWLRQTGFRLTGDLAFDLCKKADDDRKLTEAAIVKAMGSKSTYVLKYDHFKKVYDDLKAPKPKGGESGAKPSIDFTYKPVDFDYGEKPW